MNTYLLAGAALAIILVSGYMLAKPKNPPSPSSTVVQPTLEIGTFHAVFPCADCSGLDTKLTLTRSELNSDHGTYLLEEYYLGKSKESIKTTGTWLALTKTKLHPQSIVYQLNPDKPAEAQYYLKLSDTQIKWLDKDQKEIDSPFDNILKKLVQ